MSEALRVVLVDDEPDVVFLLQIQLDAVPGIVVVGTAADGADGVDRCRELGPDAVVMDLLMPKVNGFEAIAVLRRELPKVAIVAYTAVAGAFVREQMEGHDVPLVLKSGEIGPVVDALVAAVAARRAD